MGRHLRIAAVLVGISVVTAFHAAPAGSKAVSVCNPPSCSATLCIAAAGGTIDGCLDPDACRAGAGIAFGDAFRVEVLSQYCPNRSLRLSGNIEIRGVPFSGQVSIGSNCSVDVSLAHGPNQ
jgi:hypothetical protein